jgi:hypothetical protein
MSTSDTFYSTTKSIAMNKLFKYITGIAATLFLFAIVSCKKYLVEDNPAGLTAETVYSTPAGFESGVSAVYSYNRWLWGKEDGYHLMDVGTDLWLSGVDDPQQEISQYTSNLNAAEDRITFIWPKVYQAVNLCNTLINRIQNSGLPAATQKIREGELRTLRAFNYYFIVMQWGGVHFTINETSGIVTTANRTPVDTFYNQMERDLLIAEANLPATTTDQGRITKAAAQSLLAKVYLSRNKNQEAFDMANKVITNPAYSLIAYNQLWNMTTPQATLNREVIWAVNYSTNLILNDLTSAVNYPAGHPRGANNGHLHFLQKYDVRGAMERTIAYGRPFSRYMPTRFLLDLYDDDNDTRYQDSFQEVWLANKTTLPRAVTVTLSNNTTVTYNLNIGDTAHVITKKQVSNAFRDTRRYEIFDRKNVYNATGLPVNRSNFVSLKKFLDPTRPSVAEQQSARDAIVFRLADIILIAAEAKFNLNQTTDAANLINIVRRRAVKTGLPANTLDITPAQVTLDFILDERGRELAGEQWRWIDLKRTNKLISRVQANNPQAGPNIKPFHVVRPIPQTQIDAVTNPSEFTQNQGY